MFIKWNIISNFYQVETIWLAISIRKLPLPHLHLLICQEMVNPGFHVSPFKDMVVYKPIIMNVVSDVRKEWKLLSGELEKNPCTSESYGGSGRLCRFRRYLLDSVVGAHSIITSGGNHIAFCLQMQIFLTDTDFHTNTQIPCTQLGWNLQLLQM